MIEQAPTRTGDISFYIDNIAEIKAQEQDPYFVSDKDRELYESCVLDLVNDYDEPTPLLTFAAHNDKDTPVLTRGNISAIVAASKAGKTFFVDYIAAKFLIENENGKVLIADTEQSETHAQRAGRRVGRLMEANEPTIQGRLIVLNMRPLDPDQRSKVVETALKTFKPDLVFIDGMADLIYDTNDLKESQSLVGQMMRWSAIYDCSITGVIHKNPNADNDKGRGHLGTSAQHKCETIIALNKQKSTTQMIIEVTCERSRDIPFETFGICIDEYGLPREYQLPDSTAKSNAPREVKKSRFETILTPGVPMRHTDLVEQYASLANVTKGRAKQVVKEATLEGIVAKNEVGMYHLPVVEPPTQQAFDYDDQNDDQEREIGRGWEVDPDDMLQDHYVPGISEPHQDINN